MTPSQEKTLSELGEKNLLKYIIPRLIKPEPNLLPPGDDAVGFVWHGGLAVCLDVLVTETDIPLGMGWERAGRKAVVAVVSDMAAKSAQPRYLLTGLGLRGDMTFGDFESLWRGIESAASQYGASIVGGDINQCNSPFISVTAIGSAERPLTRNGAKPGNLVACTGLFGTTSAGLHAILNGKQDAPKRILESVYSPRARLKEGLALGKVGGVTACIDSSDGLAESLHCIAEASAVGIHVSSPPADPEAMRYAEEHGLDFLKMMMYGGEEYELVFTFEEESLAEVRLALDDSFNVIGRVVEGGGVTVDFGGRVAEVARLGWEHFRSGVARNP